MSGFEWIDKTVTPQWRSAVNSQSGVLTLETMLDAWEQLKRLPEPPPTRVVSPAWWRRKMEEVRGVYHDFPCDERWMIEQDFDGWTGCNCALLYGASMGRS